MKMRLLTEDAHIAIGAGLSGMEVDNVDLQDPQGVISQWSQAKKDPSVGVLVVTENVHAIARSEIDAHRDSGALPLIVILPTYGRLMHEITPPYKQGNAEDKASEVIDD